MISCNSVRIYLNNNGGDLILGCGLAKSRQAQQTKNNRTYLPAHIHSSFFLLVLAIAGQNDRSPTQGDGCHSGTESQSACQQ
jgi:hypothetical protein